MSVKFSVLISLYDKESPENLALALGSLSNQSLVADQVVVVFDGPVRKELEDVVSFFLNKLNDLTIVRLDQNKGLGLALNFGISFCRYELIARMDTDDICYPQRFERQIGYMKDNPCVSVVGAVVQEFHERPCDLNRFRSLPTEFSDILSFAKYRNPLNHPTVVFKKADVLAVGSYENMPLFEDFYLWIKLLRAGKIINNIPEPLLHFRVGNDMVGRRHGTAYFIKEARFLRAIKNMQFITSKQLGYSIAVKLPLRLLPKFALEFIYKRFLR